MNKTLFPVAILAGGLATRIRPITQDLPKALIPIQGKPFIDHQLELLFKQGLRRVVLCIGFLGEMIEAHVGDGQRYGLDVQYSYDGPILLGTGGTLKQALPLLGETFFVLNGDSYLSCDYTAIQTFFAGEAKQGLMTVFHNQGLWDTSNIEYAAGKIKAYDKKQLTEKMHHIDYGLGILSAQALEQIPAKEPYDLALLNQVLLKQEQLAAYEVKQRFYEIGSFAGIKDFEYYLSLDCRAALAMTGQRIT